MGTRGSCIPDWGVGGVMHGTSTSGCVFTAPSGLPVRKECLRSVRHVRRRRLRVGQRGGDRDRADLCKLCRWMATVFLALTILAEKNDRTAGLVWLGYKA